MRFAYSLIELVERVSGSLGQLTPLLVCDACRVRQHIPFQEIRGQARAVQQLVAPERSWLVLFRPVRAVVSDQLFDEVTLLRASVIPGIRLYRQLFDSLPF